MLSVIQVAALAVASTLVACDESVVTTQYGAVQGLLNPLAREFRGVPYGAPPVGKLRWHSPQPPIAWAPATYQAVNDPPGCLQRCHEPPLACPTVAQEDCLYLNVFTPRLPSSGPAPSWPVMVFIHGGNFRDGFAGGQLYNGSTLASSQEIVVVYINYRLGLQGFLFVNDTSDSPSPDLITGNYGFQDQQQALKWVQANIAAFGGDPGSVTLTGQSAGAMSVASHLISPGSRGLFRAAMPVSEPYALPFRDVLAAIELGAAVLNISNCTAAQGMNGYPSPAACMRALDAETLLDIQTQAQGDLAVDLGELLQIFMPFSPVTGTPDVPNWPLFSFQGHAGTAPIADVPIITGTTSEEGTLFIYAGFTFNITASLYNFLMPVVFGGGELFADILKLYPIPTPAPPDLRPQASMATTDLIFRCPSRNASSSLQLQAGRKSPVFLYEYSHLWSFEPVIWVNVTPACWQHVCHGSDLPGWFQPLGYLNWTQPELLLSTYMQNYLGSFVRTMDPGDGSGIDGSLPGVPWPVAGTGATVARMQFDLPGPAVGTNPASEFCDDFDQYGYNWY